jgi:hypothetical protein
VPARTGSTGTAWSRGRAWACARELATEWSERESGGQHQHREREAEEQRLDAETETEQRHRHQSGGDDAAPASDLDAVLGEAQQRRQQRDGGHHGDRHRGGGTDAEPRHERQPDEQHAEQRDHHGHPGEHHGATGRVERDDGGLLGRGLDASRRGIG